jgi:uncharacterized protein YecT (DUF1311 family)
MLRLMILILGLASVNAIAAAPDCGNVGSLDDAIVCLQTEVSKAEAQMGQYLDASKRRHAGDRTQLKVIDATQESWHNIRRFQCGAVNVLPRDEKKHIAEVLSCRVRELRARTHRIWESYLTYPDGRQPDLPEPGR